MMHVKVRPEGHASIYPEVHPKSYIFFLMYIVKSLSILRMQTAQVSGYIVFVVELKDELHGAST